MIYVEDFSIVGEELKVFTYTSEAQKECDEITYNLEDFYYWIDDNGHNNIVIDYQRGGEHQQIDTVVDPVQFFEDCHNQTDLVQQFINR